MYMHIYRQIKALPSNAYVGQQQLLAYITTLFTNVQKQTEHFRCLFLPNVLSEQENPNANR